MFCLPISLRSLLLFASIISLTCLLLKPSFRKGSFCYFRTVLDWIFTNTFAGGLPSFSWSEFLFWYHSDGIGVRFPHKLEPTWCLSLWTEISLLLFNNFSQGALVEAKARSVAAFGPYLPLCLVIEFHCIASGFWVPQNSLKFEKTSTFFQDLAV